MIMRKTSFFLLLSSVYCGIHAQAIGMYLIVAQSNATGQKYSRFLETMCTGIDCYYPNSNHYFINNVVSCQFLINFGKGEESNFNMK